MIVTRRLQADAPTAQDGSLVVCGVINYNINNEL